MKAVFFAVLFAALVLLLGCSSQPPAGQAPTGKLVLLVSDEEANIGDFSSVNVTFDSARVFFEDENKGFKEMPLNDAKADLVQLIGENALSVGELQLEAGRYSKIELNVKAIEAYLISGDLADVKIPSEKLQITRPFTIDANTETKFVFDIQVVKKGQTYEYNLMPNIAKSGVVGKDLAAGEVKEVKEAKPEKPEEPEAKPPETAGDADGKKSAEAACTESGGTVITSFCCTSAGDFPNSCLIGACGCGPGDSHEVKTCDCGESKCFNGKECIAQGV
ncbi:MAG: DUF4382 domain-containing protein [Candidatus Diapherotrites archaeon]|nr:DUF4382 domain-containing protein [Candidatus Diapherotrites archaeon]